MQAKTTQFSSETLMRDQSAQHEVKQPQARCGINDNHNETVVRDQSAQRQTKRSHTRSGVNDNHNETVVRDRTI
jgi:hypothetical protein